MFKSFTFTVLKFDVILTILLNFIFALIPICFVLAIIVNYIFKQNLSVGFGFSPGFFFLGCLSLYQTISQFIWFLAVGRFEELNPCLNLRKDYFILSGLLIILLYPAAVVFGTQIFWILNLTVQLWALVYVYIQLYSAQESFGFKLGKLRFLLLPIKKLFIVLFFCIVIGLSLSYLYLSNVK